MFWVGLSVGWVGSRLGIQLGSTIKNWGRVKKREERSGEGQDMRSWRKVGCYLEGAGGFLPPYLRASGPSTAQ